MRLFPEEVAACFRTHHGVATGAMLSDVGFGRRQRAHAVEDGLLVPMYERVFRMASAEMTIELRCAALSLAYGQGFVTGPTGGQLMGVRRVGAGLPVHFSVPHGTHIGPFADVRIRQSTKTPRSHVVVRADGIRIASATRLAFDLASDVSPLDHRSIVEQLLADGKCTMTTLGAMARTMVHPARPGSARFLDTLMNRQGKPVDSHPELLVLQGLRARGVPVVTQVQPLRLPKGKSLTVDLAVPAVRWGVEVDVHPGHLLLDGTSRDKWRDRQCHKIGWQVERVTELDLLDLEGICDELTELYQLRCRAVGHAA